MPTIPNNDPSVDGSADFNRHNFDFENKMKAIYRKYARNFNGFADEIDIWTGKILVDNGHIKLMQDVVVERDGWGIPTMPPIKSEEHATNSTTCERPLKTKLISLDTCNAGGVFEDSAKLSRSYSTGDSNSQRSYSQDPNTRLITRSHQTLQNNDAVATTPANETSSNLAKVAKSRRRKKRGSRMRFTRRRG